MTILVTGAAGFIGFHTVRRLVDAGRQVVGMDSVNDYYDVNLKHARLQSLADHCAGQFHFQQGEIEDPGAVDRLVRDHGVTHVIHLAAQAGVRYSIDHPEAYVDSNVMGFLKVMDACRDHGVQHLIYASSSSVYGDSLPVPFSTTARVDRPVSIYAASKLANELMAHVYYHQFGMNMTGLRFFTVYGPWGRPDMSPYLFVKAILNGETVRLFNQGHHSRDFTYVDDIVEGIVRILDQTGEGAANRLYNIGRGQSVGLIDYVDTIERIVGIKAKRELLPMQPGDVEDTWADVTPLQNDYGYAPATDLEDGLRAFIDWYRGYHGV